MLSRPSQCRHFAQQRLKAAKACHPAGGDRTMLRIDAERSVSFCDGWSRRDFLHAGSLSMLGLTLPSWMSLVRGQGTSAQQSADKDVNCIMLFLVGGPSHIDTW